MEPVRLEEWYEANLSEGIETESSEDHLEGKLHDVCDSLYKTHFTCYESKATESFNDNPQKIISKEKEICQPKMLKPGNASTNKIQSLEDENNKKIATLLAKKVPPLKKNSKNQSTKSLQVQIINIEEQEKNNSKERDLCVSQENYTCPDSQCTKQLKSKVDLINHILCFHSLKCQVPFCRYSTFMFGEYLQHFKVNHSVNQVLPTKRIVGYGHHAEF